MKNNHSPLPFTFILFSVPFIVMFGIDKFYNTINLKLEGWANVLMFALFIVLIFVLYKSSLNVFIEHKDTNTMKAIVISVVVIAIFEIILLYFLNLFFLMGLLWLSGFKIIGAISLSMESYMYLLMLIIVILSIYTSELIYKYMKSNSDNVNFATHKIKYQNYADFTIIATVLLTISTLLGDLNFSSENNLSDSEDLFNHLFSLTLATFAIKHGIYRIKFNIEQNIERNIERNIKKSGEQSRDKNLNN